MDEERAELSSASTTLGDLAARVEAVGKRLHDEGEEGFAAELFEVERGLRSAHRRLEQTLGRLR